MIHHSEAEIEVRFVGEGLHCWPGAPDRRRAYLRFPHRHLFHVTARTTIPADDSRSVEFFDVRDQIEIWWNQAGGEAHDFGASSCETLAARIGAVLCESFAGRSWSVTVSEDGECGATVRTTMSGD